MGRWRSESPSEVFGDKFSENSKEKNFTEIKELLINYACGLIFFKLVAKHSSYSLAKERAGNWLSLHPKDTFTIMNNNDIRERSIEICQ